MHNFLDPAILFFLFGVLAALLKSNLEIPPQVSRFLSLYLLMALGLKGGFALSHTGLTREVATSLAAAVVLALAIPALGYQLLRRLLPPLDAAAVAATYGSVSAVTFVTATQYLEGQGVAFGGHMAAAMALMESPAIVMAVLLANHVRSKLAQTAQQAAIAGGVVLQAGGGAAMLAGGGAGGLGHGGAHSKVGALLRESLTDGSQILLLGAMAVGLLTGDAGKAAMQPFTGDLFKGMLAFFLLDMGLLAARNMRQLGDRLPWLLAYAALCPVVHAGLALALAAALGLSVGNGALLMVLAASASYIAVPAALRYAIPEADPAVYLSLSLGITFPLNITLGIAAYSAVAVAVLG